MGDNDLLFFQNISFADQEGSSNKVFIYLKNNLFTSQVERVLIIFYALVSTSGVVSNLLVIGAIVGSKSLKYRDYSLLLNLCLADTFMCVFSLPFTLFQLLRRHWIFGSVACHLMPPIQAAIAFALSLTVMLIAFDRASIITGHYTKRLKKSICFCRNRIGLIWSISITLATPLILFHREAQVGFGEIVLFNRCTEYWPNYVKWIYSIITLTMSLILPSIFLLVCHVKILRFLTRQNSYETSVSSIKVKRRGETALFRSESVKHWRNAKAIFSLRRILLTFVISWLPLNIVTVCMDFGSNSDVSSQTLYLLLAISHLLAGSSATSNALLYGIWNTNIKRELVRFKRMWKFEKSSGSSSQS